MELINVHFEMLYDSKTETTHESHVIFKFNKHLILYTANTLIQT